MLVPHHLNPPPPPPIPISEKGYYPLSLVLVTISNYQKHPLFLAFLGNIPETKATRYPPFPRKWEHACSPFMVSSGGPGHKSVSKSQILRNAGIFSTYFLCRAWLNVRCEVRGYRFLCLRPARVPEALCFRVVHPYGNLGILLPRYLENPWVDFYHTWPRGVHMWQVDELIRFWSRYLWLNITIE